MWRFKITLKRTMIAALVAGLAGLASLAIAQETQSTQDTVPLKLTAFAVNLGTTTSPRPTRPGARTDIVEISIERWSTDQDRESLIETFRESGANALLTALQKAPRVGYIRTPDSIGWELHYAHEMPLPDGGRRIFIATDRRLGFWELSHSARSADYPFTLIEIHLDRNGKGEGRMSIATKIILGPDHHHIELENYSTQPVRLQSVQVQTR